MTAVTLAGQDRPDVLLEELQRRGIRRDVVVTWRRLRGVDGQRGGTHNDSQQGQTQKRKSSWSQALTPCPIRNLQDLIMVTARVLLERDSEDFLANSEVERPIDYNVTLPASRESPPKGEIRHEGSKNALYRFTDRPRAGLRHTCRLVGRRVGFTSVRPRDMASERL